MATTFPYTVGQLAANAYRKLGFLQAGVPMSDDQLNQAIMDYNLMVTGTSADGTNLWRREQISINVGSLQGSIANPITLDPPVMDLSDARWVVTSGPGPQQYERPMQWDFPYSYYMNLPNKLSQSQSGPSICVFDRQNLPASNLYIYPLQTVPGVLNCTVARSFNTVSNTSDPIDFPVEWLEGITYMLADRLMEDEGLSDAEGGQNTAQRITQHALAFASRNLNFDRPTSMFVRPWGKTGQSRFWRR